MTPLLDLTRVRWIEQRVTGSLGLIESIAPDGFPSYVRLFHPVDDSTRWADVANANERVAHPLMQWNSICRRLGSSTEWSPQPETGNLAPATLARLAAILSLHTQTPDDCLFALWEGRGWMHGGRSVAMFTRKGGRPSSRIPPGITDAHLAGPRLNLPWRNHILFEGQLRNAGNLGWRPHPGTFFPQSPSVFWPEDRAWVVSTEIDFDSTIVACSTATARALLAAAGLETAPVSLGDSLAISGDLINS